MQRLKTLVSAARFTIRDLAGWTAKDLRALEISNEFIRSSDKVTTFRAQYNIAGSLNGAEQAIIAELRQAASRKELSSLTDVHSHFLGHQETYYGPDGLHHIVPQKSGKKVDEVIKKAIWVAPPGLADNFPGIQWLVGMILTCVKREEGRIVSFYDSKAYQELAFTGLDAPQLRIFSSVVLEFIGKWFTDKRNTGNGRVFIEELFLALSSLSKEEYLTMHWAIALGPLNQCFNWAQKIKSANKKTRLVEVQQKTSENVKWHLLSVRKEHEKSFQDASSTETGKKMKGSYGGDILPVWVGPIKTYYEIPAEPKMATVHEFMTMCRNQRQTDEKGLSAWSSGFGATGNPTKMQLRLNKKMSIILGLVASVPEGHSVLIFDDQVSEISTLHAQLQRWITMKPGVFKRRTYRFCVVSSNTSVLSDLKGWATTTPLSTKTTLHRIYFPDGTPSIPKATEWSKVEADQKKRIKTLIGEEDDSESEYLSDEEEEELPIPATATSSETKTVDPNSVLAEEQKKTVDKLERHVHIYSPIMSELLFEDWYVYTLGSAHNMMGILSSMSTFPFARSDGTECWNFSVEIVNAINVSTFYSRVLNHNGSRCSFFMNGTFHFNAKLNLLRHIPGKTINFVTGTLDAATTIALEPDELMAKFGSEALAQIEGQREIEDSGEEDDEGSEEEKEEVEPAPPAAKGKNGKKHRQVKEEEDESEEEEESPPQTRKKRKEKEEAPAKVKRNKGGIENLTDF